MTAQDEPEEATSGGGPAATHGRDADPGRASDSTATHRRRALATRIERDVASPLPWRSIAKKSRLVVVAGITIYLVFPSLAEVFSSFPKLTELDPIWFAFALVLQVAHFTCTIALQRIALRTKAWFSVTTSQLAGNAISLIVPGGAAFGAATQFRMLAASGNDAATAVGGLTAFSLLGIGGLLALPIFVLPAILAGTPIDSGLEHAALLGIVAFVLFAGFGAAVLVLDGPLRWAGGSSRRSRNRLLRKRTPMSGLPERLVFERNRIRDVLGQAVEGGHAAEQRAPRLRLRHAAGDDPGHRGEAEPVAGPAGLRRGRPARVDPHHTRWARHRRGRA